MFSYEERQYVERKINEIAFRKDERIVQCPACNAFCQRKAAGLKIICTKCRVLDKNTVFCFRCLHRWDQILDVCENKECKITEAAIGDEIVNSAEKIIIKNNEVPGIRKCPSCGILIEFYSKVKSCKTVVCICGKRICFICMRSVDKDSEEILCWEDGMVREKEYDEGKKCELLV